MTEIPPNALRARQMYVDGAAVRAIEKATEWTSYAVYFWIDGGPIIDGRRLLPPIPRRMLRMRKISTAERVALVNRIVRSSERQVSEIEHRINPSPGQLDRDARTLSVIARTLNELGAIDEREREKRRKKAPRDNGESRPPERPIPRSAEELERSLARKLEAIIAEQDSEIRRDS